jgi:N-acylglucosamine-6-phosphate 2-epimerase
MNSMIARLGGALIVSCQAYPGEPMRDPSTMTRVAQSVVLGGAAGVRLEGIDDVRAAREFIDVPIIGIVKRGRDGVTITPTVEDGLALIAAGADIVALDGTRRPRPDGLSLAETVSRLRETGRRVIMADCSSVEDARAAADCGVDLIGTTLVGYTGDRPATIGPDLHAVAAFIAATPVPVVAEGRYESPAEVARAFDLGAHAVCVGSAITHPIRLTRRFLRATALREQ